MGKDDAGRAQVPPPPGDYGGGTYTGEAATSDLAARPGGVLLDYFRVVLPDKPSVMRRLSDWLGAMTPRAGGWHGWYNRSLSVLEGGIVAWCNDPCHAQVEGILVDLPGRACAHLGEKLVPFVKWCLQVGRVARADFAMDDFRNLLQRDRILEAERNGELVTRWQRGIVQVSNWTTGAWTLYLGSRHGEAYVRIYNKKVEQEGKGKTVDAPYWVRFEMECKGAFADALTRRYFEEGSAAVVGQIARRVRFVVRNGSDSNKRRASAVGWWAEFLGSVEPGQSLKAGEKPECTIESIKAWAEHAVGPTLATIMTADGGNLEWLAGVLDRSQRRMKSKHHAALAMAAREAG